MQLLIHNTDSILPNNISPDLIVYLERSVEERKERMSRNQTIEPENFLFFRLVLV